MTDAEVQRIVTVLVAAFPNTLAKLEEEQQKATMSVYRRMLADLDYPLVNAAVERLLATAKFMPTVAEIRESALAIAGGEQKPGGEAWGAVLKAVGRYGVNRTPGKDFAWDDEVTQACVAALGWRELCLSENQAADRARFIELYDRLAIHHRRKQLSEHLPAMQRYRALEEKRMAELTAPRTSEAQSVGQLLRLITDKAAS